MAYNESVRFKWDEEKNRANQAKHGIAFQEAQRLLESGANFLEIFDSARSLDDDRFIAIGPMPLGSSWSYGQNQDSVVRVISARAASRREVQYYRSKVEGEL